MSESIPQFQILEPTNEDTVACLFFYTNPNLSSWEQLTTDINNTIETLTKDYIWHKDEFKLYPPIIDKNHMNTPYYLTSTTCFGDNIEDEWFIVYLVLEITKQHKSVIVQMRDTDGDFLLIEAADYLPSWTTPENTENRVFIYNGHIHIIPPHIASLETKLELQEAIQLLQNSNEETQVLSDIENAILMRIGNYPDKIKENIHKAIVNLPIDLATLLCLKPSLIAPIVCAYCNHDVIDAKACKKITFENCVAVEIKFTKCLYAMLIHAKPMKYIKHPSNTENVKKNSLGFKLTCGFQIIMASMTDVFSSKQYNTFENSLIRNGYFQGNIAGSKPYQALLNKAKDFFLAIECPVNSNVSHQILELMSADDFKKTKELVTANNTTGLSEDNEDWLNIHPDHLNELLNKRYGKQVKFKNKDNISSTEIANELSNFLTKTSDYEGIEINKTDKTEDCTIEFQADEFNSCLEKFLNLLSSKDDNMAFDSNSSDEDENMAQFEENDDNEELDRELKSKLNNDVNDNLHNNETILSNIVQSIKAENASTGPSSNLLSAVGRHKTDFLDSDDDDY